MNIDKYFKLINVLFILFIIILLLISFNEYFGLHLNRYYPEFYFYECHYKLSHENYTECKSKSFWYKYIWVENGLVENLQLILLFSTIILIITSLIKINLKKLKIFKYFLILNLIGLSFIFFEETSWMQHFLLFKTPEIIENINYQKEFNLHNSFRIFNEIPRSLVLIWCCFGSISYFLLKNKVNEEVKIILLPSNKIIFISLILILFTLPNVMVDKFHLLDWYNLHINYAGNEFGHERHLIFSPLIKEGFNLYQFMIVLLSSNYFRFSEFQELIFYYYFHSHTIYFIHKLKIYINENSNNNI
jgi:hypothetical protein